MWRVILDACGNQFQSFQSFNGSTVREASRQASATAFVQAVEDHHDRLDHPLVLSSDGKLSKDALRVKTLKT